MQEMTVREDIPLAADAAWAVIGDFSGIRKWATLVEAESTEVTPEGKVRTLTMPGGRTVSELMTDGGPYHYTYSLDRPDMDAYFSTVSVEPGAGDACAGPGGVGASAGTGPTIWTTFAVSSSGVAGLMS